jgi:hypothetical protein
VATITEWLASLGLPEYAQHFAENGIDVSVLRYLTDQDLEKIGVLLGHRRKMLAAIAELSGAAPVMPQPASPPEEKRRHDAERRQLTIMFCDLVGSTALSARLGPEDLRGIITTYHRCCTELVERNGGFVAKYMVMAFSPISATPKRMNMTLSAQFAPGSVSSRRFRSSPRMPVRPCRFVSASPPGSSWSAI